MQTWFYLIVFAFAVLCTVLLRSYALKRNVIDVPGERSSHTMPTPRGGGMSIVLAFIIAIALFTYYGLIDIKLGMTFLLSGTFIAIIGFIDDHGHIDAKWRLLVHSLAAFLVVYYFDGLPLLQFFGFEIDFGWLGYVLAIVAIIWILNLFNFMDGIDGIAGVEAITATFFSGLFLSFISPDSALVPLHWLLATSVCGFLALNFPPAKIFMGDAGSGFLGFMLAVLALSSAHENQSMLWVWLVLLGVFIVDATFTLINRLVKKEKLHEAHCSHAYQFAARKYNSHLKVTISVLLINILWLSPIAYFITVDLIGGAIGLIIAYIPLVLIAFKFKAGNTEVQKRLESNV